jgi:prepilin-type processing-associated H-X9-DG protein
MNNRFKPEDIKSELPTREVLLDLPLLNRWLLGGGAALVALGFLASVGPPVASSVSRSVHPYTGQGKQEQCLAHLQAVGMAIASYREEHGGLYPILEQRSEIKGGKSQNKDSENKDGETGAEQNRSTWVTQVSPDLIDSNFLCPSGNGDGVTTSSYAFNPALSGVNQDDIDHPENVIVLAERGEADDISLLPPLEGWRQVKAPGALASASGGTASGATGAAIENNFDYRHGNKVGVLFADGRVEFRNAGDWSNDVGRWGGALAMRQARLNLLKLHSTLGQIQKIADQVTGKGNKNQNGDEAVVKFMQQRATKDKAFEKALQATYGLWMQNDPTVADGDNFDAETDRWGWQLARWAERAGQPDFLRFFDKEQSRRSQALLQEAGESARNKAWTEQQTTGYKLSVPPTWTREEQVDGRYRRTYFRPASPHISVLVERGERNTPGPESGIEWAGIEAEFKRTYGKRYKRIALGETTLAGEAASMWEFEIERKDAPNLRKLYIGRSHAWDSVIFTATAPAKDFASWRSLFLQTKDGLQRS